MPHKIEVVLVDKNDQVLGLKEKYAAHQIPVALHRAISIVIFDPARKQILITQRAATKPTWPLFWSNSVCSHPYPDEAYQDTADRRVFEELGFRTKLDQVFKFTYQAEMENKLFGEHEYDVVFTGTYSGAINPNPDEIADYAWIKIDELKKEIVENPKKFTPWFKLILERLKL